MGAADFSVSTSLSLLERSLAGETDAWSRLDDIYAPMIYRWIRECGFQPTDASDLTQEIFIRVFKNLATFQQGPGRFRGWLWTITRNAIRDVVRERDRKQLPISSVDLAIVEVKPCDAEDSGLPPREVVKRALKHLLEDFDERTRIIVEEVIMAGRDPGEVAKELDVSRNTVYIARSRALKKLRKLLGGTEFSGDLTE